MLVERTVTIQASCERVWDVITDLRNAKHWAPGFEDYPYISPNWPSRGARATWRYHSGPMSWDFQLELLESRRGESLKIANTSAFGRGVEVYRFRFENLQTTVEYCSRSEPNLLGRIFEFVGRRKLENQMDSTIANLKRYCESVAR